jgi:hypothetical protein
MADVCEVGDPQDKARTKTETVVETPESRD